MLLGVIYLVAMFQTPLNFAYFLNFNMSVMSVTRGLPLSFQYAFAGLWTFIEFVSAPIFSMMGWYMVWRMIRRRVRAIIPELNLPR